MRPRAETRKTTRYQLIDYDVWGNRRDGFWVNDAHTTNTYVELPDDATDAEIIRILKREDILKKGLRASSIGIDGELGEEHGVLYFEHKPTGRPEFELRAVRRTA